jgi:hypothetical protein
VGLRAVAGGGGFVCGGMMLAAAIRCAAGALRWRFLESDEGDKGGRREEIFNSL